MNALVVGAGEMGRWLADVLGDAGFEVAVADADPDVAAAAADALDVRAAPVEGDERFDLVCVAVPIPAAVGALAAAAPRADRALLDVTGTMADPVAAMREHAPDRERVSLHPLFAADAEPGNVAVVPDATGPVTDTVRETLAERDNHLFETTPEEHDRAMETVQARVHAAVLAYGLAAEEVPEEFHTPVSAGLAELVERVTDGDPGVYADIQAAFGGAADVAEAARRVAEADRETFQQLYEDA
ncbi:MAG: prephenate dehydrogenase/arogenate dehydrogenase family protein [Haloarculaceae archaeon]